MKHENFITKYCEILDETHGQRPDLLWFSTWMASKSPYYLFPKKFENYWFTNSPSKDLSFFKKLKLAARLTVTLASLILKSTYLKFIFRAELKKLHPSKSYNILRTFLFSPVPGKRDPFWGDFIRTLEMTDHIVIFEPNFSVFKCRYLSGLKNHFPYFVFLKPRPLIQHFFLLIKEAFNNSEIGLNTPPDLKRLMKTCYSTELLSPAALTTLAFYECFFELFQKVNVRNLYITFENNPWEKMCYLARSDVKKNFNIFGFQHATVQEDATNYRLSEYEVQNNLVPDKIYTVGKLTHDLLKSYPHYKNIPVEIGCGLRYSYLDQINSPVTQSDFAPFKLLVALDGTADAVYLVHFIESTIRSCAVQNIEIRIKEHPNQLLTSQQRLNITPLRDQIRISQGTLLDELNWANALLYSGTTVSLEALKMGKSLIHYNHGLFNYDPLFLFTKKYVVKNAEELSKAIQHIQNKSKEEFESYFDSGTSFVKEYFYPCTTETLERFLGS